jgi:hypothetical protein
VWYHLLLRKLVVRFGFLLLLAGPASAATAPTGTQWIVKQYGFSIVVPAKWYPVPRTVAEINAVIANLKKQKNTGLATAYGFYTTANGRTELKAYVFEAFYYNGPTTDPVPLSVSVQVDKRIAYAAKDLPAAVRAYGNSFASIKGAKIAAPKLIKLPAGQAEYLTGTVPNGGGVSTGLGLYILVHAKKLYVLSFKIDAALLSRAADFRAIAENFRFL